MITQRSAGISNGIFVSRDMHAICPELLCVRSIIFDQERDIRLVTGGQKNVREGIVAGSLACAQQNAGNSGKRIARNDFVKTRRINVTWDNKIDLAAMFSLFHEPVSLSEKELRSQGAIYHGVTLAIQRHPI